MATSSKVVFDLATLREKALESLDLRIANAQLEVDSYSDDAAMAVLVSDWRERQIGKLRALTAQLDADESAVDNHRLNKFKLDPIPEEDKWDRREAERTLNRLTEKRAQVVAKSAALKPDEGGTVSLTKTQLQEFFGL